MKKPNHNLIKHQQQQLEWFRSLIFQILNSDISFSWTKWNFVVPVIVWKGILFYCNSPFPPAELRIAEYGNHQWILSLLGVCYLPQSPLPSVATVRGGQSCYLQYIKMMCAYSKLLNQCATYTYRIVHNVFSGRLILKHINCYLGNVLLPDEKKCCVLCCTYEILSRMYEILSHTYEILSHKYEIHSRSYEIISRTYKILSRTYDILSRTYDILSRSYDIICRYFLIINFCLHFQDDVWHGKSL